MVERKDVASWLEGPGGARGRAPGDPPEYAGQRLGRPRSGPGSVAGFGARIVAYLIDSVACAVISYGLFRDQAWTVVIFAVEVLLLVPALIWDRDGRGLHDKAADSVVVNIGENAS